MITPTSPVRATNEPEITDDNPDPEQGSLRSEQLLTDLLTHENLDKMISVSKSNNELLIDLDYEVVVDDATGRKSSIFLETPFTEIYAKMVKSKNLKLMNHPVVESVLTAKWNSIKVAYIFNLVLYAIFVAILTCHFTLSENNPDDQSYYILSSSTHYDYSWLKLISVIIVMIYICFLFILELIQIFTLKYQYLSSGKWLENLPDWITIVSTSIFITAYLSSQYTVSVPALSIAMLFGK